MDREPARILANSVGQAVAIVAALVVFFALFFGWHVQAQDAAGAAGVAVGVYTALAAAFFGAGEAIRARVYSPASHEAELVSTAETVREAYLPPPGRPL